MFDLEREVQRWRRELLGDGLNASELDELEDHLRTEVEQQLRSGTALREAFDAAEARIGRGRLLKAQFKQADATTKNRNVTFVAKATIGTLVAWTVVFAGVCCVTGFPIALKSSAALFALVLLAISAGVIWTHRRGRPGTSPDLSEFAPGAQQCLDLAQKEAHQLGHDYVGTEHVLLALASLDTGAVAGVLEKAGVAREALRRDIEKRISACTAQGVASKLPHTPRLENALRLAVREAASDRGQADSEHVLLGLLSERSGIAGRVLRSFGFSVGQVRSWLA